jgi:mannobiose 2-epimerase
VCAKWRQNWNDAVRRKTDNDMDLDRFKQELTDELHNDVLPFWERMADPEHGGFYGRMDGRGELHPEAPKGVVLNARILWTFSAACRVSGNGEYLAAAARARDYLLEHFIDRRYGGVYWLLDHRGAPMETRKQMYAQGFAIYGLSEYHRATGDGEALDAAVGLFRLVEQHARDARNGGYTEALDRAWQPLSDMRLSDRDANLSKTMNTHLHIIEPYVNLYRVWPNELLGRRIRELLAIFAEKIVGTDGHLGLFFDDGWQRHGDTVSYGHDIEASWLLHEAAFVSGDDELLASAESLVKRIAAAAVEGLQSDGGMAYEFDRAAGRTDLDRHWWVQAETVAGYFNLWQHFGDTEALQRAVGAWEYIKAHLIDRRRGEWFWSVRGDGSINTTDDKAGPWKCPYHNGRMCLEIIDRLR